MRIARDLHDGLLVGADHLEARQVPATLGRDLDEDVRAVAQGDAPSRHDAVQLRKRANPEGDRAGHHVRHRDAGTAGLTHLVDVRERALHRDIDDGIDRRLLPKADTLEAEFVAVVREGRMHILHLMQEAMPHARTEISQHAPRMMTFKINPEKIRDVIGKGGAVIRALALEGLHAEGLDDAHPPERFVEDGADSGHPLLGAADYAALWGVVPEAEVEAFGTRLRETGAIA